jgi:hypothetical protein
MPRVIRLDGVQQFAAIELLVDPGHIAGPVVIPNACRVRLNWNLTDGKVAHNVLYAAWTGTPALSQTVAQAIFAAISTGANWSALAVFLAPTTFLAGVTLQDVRTATGIEINSTGGAVAGGSASPAMPDEIAVAVTLKTANRGPSGRGRFFVPGFATNTIAAGNVIAAAAVTALTTWANTTLNGAIVGNLGQMVLALPARNGYTSLATGRIFPPRAAGSVPLTQLLCRDNHFDSQRRRGLR